MNHEHKTSETRCTQNWQNAISANYERLQLSRIAVQWRALPVVLVLFQSKDVLVEVVLQLLIGKVDVELLKAIDLSTGIRGIKQTSNFTHTQ